MAFYVSRFKGTERREFEVEVITPLFLGGATPKKAELRAPSIKGLLRFWWRALYGDDHLEGMKKREAELFGSTDKKANFSISLKNKGDSKPILKDLPPGQKIPTKSKGKTFKISIIEYLAYGLCKRNVYTKEHIPEGSKFTICLDFYNTIREEQILNSLKALVTFGGIGARSRNGFGSILIENGLFPSQPTNGLKNFTSFSEKSQLFTSFSQHGKWEDALSEIGWAYRAARLSIETKHIYNKRLLVAKPIPQAHNNKRHAKPYFLHVNKLPNGKYKGQILFMPYNYYDSSKRKEYFQTCEQMNKKIVELSGGSK